MNSKKKTITPLGFAEEDEDGERGSATNDELVKYLKEGCQADQEELAGRIGKRIED